MRFLLSTIAVLLFGLPVYGQTAGGAKSCSPIGCQSYTQSYQWPLDDASITATGNTTPPTAWTAPDDGVVTETGANSTFKYPPTNTNEVLLSWGVTVTSTLGNSEECMVNLMNGASTIISSIIVGGGDVPTNLAQTGVACTADSGAEPFSTVAEWCYKDFADVTIVPGGYWNAEIADIDALTGNNDCASATDCDCSSLRAIQISVNSRIDPL